MSARHAWERQARRIDALGLRERCFLFLSVALVCAALADSLVLSPAISEQRQLSLRRQQQDRELAALRAQLAAAHQPADPSTPQARLRSEIRQAQAQQATLDAEIRQLGQSAGGHAALPQLLERTLARHERLTLLKLATVAEAPAGGPAASAPPAALRWQGVDLGVGGSYADLVAYLAALEQALPGLRWDTLKLSAGSTGTSTLALRVYLVEAVR